MRLFDLAKFLDMPPQSLCTLERYGRIPKRVNGDWSEQYVSQIMQYINMLRQACNVSQMAKRVGVSITLVRRLMAEGRLPQQDLHILTHSYWSGERSHTVFIRLSAYVRQSKWLRKRLPTH